MSCQGRSWRESRSIDVGTPPPFRFHRPKDFHFVVPLIGHVNVAATCRHGDPTRKPELSVPVAVRPDFVLQLSLEGEDGQLVVAYEGGK